MREEVEAASGSRRIDQVVQLAAAGQTDPQIAEALGISVHTIGTYWKRLRQQWGVSTRTAVVMAHLRDRLERQGRTLAAELTRRTAAEEKLQAAFEELRIFHESTSKTLTSQLVDFQKAAVWSHRREAAAALHERATHAAHAVIYELESFDPVVHSYLSSSAARFGIDVESALRGDTTYYDLVHPEDLHELYVKMLGVRYAPGKRYSYLYRILMPEPRWVLDTNRPMTDPQGQVVGLVGVAVDVQDLVDAGLIEARVAVVATDADFVSDLTKIVRPTDVGLDPIA